MTRTTPLTFAVALEGATGLALTIYPQVLAWPLLGESLTGAGVVIGRIAGFALFSLAIACWADRDVAGETTTASLRALLTYNMLITLYLFGLGVSAAIVGPLLWPAFLLHAVMTLLLARSWLASER